MLYVEITNFSKSKYKKELLKIVTELHNKILKKRLTSFFQVTKVNET